MNSDSNQEFIEKFEKFEKEYLKNPDSEEIASEYLDILFDLASKQEDEQSLREIVDKASIVYDDHSYSEDIVDIYLILLFYLATIQEGDEQLLKETFRKASIVYDEHGGLEKVANNYLWILRSLVSKQEDEESLKDTADKASTVYDNYSDSDENANNYLWILYYLARQQEDEQSLKETADKASTVYDSYSDSEENANNYLWILYFLAKQQEDEQSLKETADKLSTVYDSYSDSEENANNYLWILYFLAKQQEDEQSLKETANKASTVYANHSDSEENADNYLCILRCLALKQEDEESLKDIADKASTVYANHSDLKGIAENYSTLLLHIASKQEDEESLKDIANKASEVYESYLSSEKIAKNYSVILFFLAPKQEDEKSLRNIVDRASEVYAKYPDSERIAGNYLWTLYCLAKQQEDEKSLRDIADKASEVYAKYPDSEGIASDYLRILYYLAKQQEDEKSLKETVDKASAVYKKEWKEKWELDPIFLSILECLALKQEKVEDLNQTVDVATTIYKNLNYENLDYNKELSIEIIDITYLKILCYLASKEKDGEKLKDIKSTADAIYNKYSNFVEVIKLFGKILISMIRIENNIETLNKHLIELESLLGTPLKERVDLVVEIISDILSNLNKKINHGEIIEQAELRHWVEKFINKLHSIESVQKTNNGMLLHLLDGYKHDRIGTEYILNIYSLVLKIKYELAVKEFPRKGFGHYTSARTLQIHLNQEENIAKQRGYKVTSKSRLYNVDYMNDPEEGKILDRYLSQQKANKIDDSLEPSPWFLMCLTTAIDDLAMWSQYGANAEGVFLELKSDSFQLVSAPKDIDWLSGQSNFGETNNNQDKEHSLSEPESKQESEKEKLFRICYLDEHELKKGKLLVSSEDVLLKKKEREKVTSLLSKLKEKIDNVYELENPELLSDVNKLLEEIRYLFKASGYKYEKELRVLRYATIESIAIESKESTTNTSTSEEPKESTANASTSEEPKVTELIGIQYDSDMLAKPYLEREDPIQIKRVIFGPKFSRPEYVTPLIRLVDKDIEFTTSERKFK